MKRPVDVLVFFENGAMDPINFQMNGRVYSVNKVLETGSNQRVVTFKVEYGKRMVGKLEYSISLQRWNFSDRFITQG